jgi:hypothetical protein
MESFVSEEIKATKVKSICGVLSSTLSLSLIWISWEICGFYVNFVDFIQTFIVVFYKFLLQDNNSSNFRWLLKHQPRCANDQTS